MTIKGPYEIIHYFTGLSTDTKPTGNAVLGDRFFETDTRLWYIYDGSSWSVMKEEFSLGVLQLAATTEDLQQAASTYDLFTGTTQAVVVEKVVLAVPNVNVSDDATITYITIQTDHSTPQVIFNSTSGAKANLTAEAQLSWTGAIYLPAGKKIQLTIAGGAADAPTVCNITAQYRAVVAGGTLA